MFRAPRFPSEKRSPSGDHRTHPSLDTSQSWRSLLRKSSPAGPDDPRSGSQRDGAPASHRYLPQVVEASNCIESLAFHRIRTEEPSLDVDGSRGGGGNRNPSSRAECHGSLVDFIGRGLLLSPLVVSDRRVHVGSGPNFDDQLHRKASRRGSFSQFSDGRPRLGALQSPSTNERVPNATERAQSVLQDSSRERANPLGSLDRITVDLGDVCRRAEPHPPGLDQLERDPESVPGSSEFIQRLPLHCDVRSLGRPMGVHCGRLRIRPDDPHRRRQYQHGWHVVRHDGICDRQG